MSDPLRIALCQIVVEDGGWEGNLDRGMSALERAVSQGASIAILPELWTSGYDFGQDQSSSKAAPPDPDYTRRWAGRNLGAIEKIREHCRSIGIACVSSWIVEASDNSLRNRLIAIDNSGEVAATYDKMHLFPGLGEPAVFERGDAPAFWRSPWGECGLALCYDLRFPEIFRHYFRARAPIIFMPSQWPFPRIEHWRLLLRARALENNCFIAAVNAASRPADNRLFGFSAIIDPWGDPVVELGHSEQVVTVELDLEKIREAEEKLGLHKNQHPIFREKK